MPYAQASAVEIDRKLREDFRKRLKEYGVTADVTDPVLAVLFRTFAQQLEVLYSETGRIRLALLDELIAGLGLHQRLARPAQAVIRFAPSAQGTLVEAGTPLVGESPDGAKLTFTTDASIVVSDARLSFATAYEDGLLRLLPGVEMPEAFQAARPSLEPVKVNLGPNPALYMAVDLPAGGRLSGHAFYFDLNPDARAIQRALEHEAWCLAGAGGEFGGPGILRPAHGNAGVRGLEWLIASRGASEAVEPRGESAPLPPGFYAGRIYRLPAVPRDRELECRVPRVMEAALSRMFGRETPRLLNVPRAWIKIAFPRGLPALHTGIGTVGLHAMTASNVECLNQTVYFEKHGNSIPIGNEGGTPWHLVAPLSVMGESDTPYLPPTEPSTDPNAGRYAFRGGRIELTPARWPDGNPHSYANLRMWISQGEAANAVGPGKISSSRLSITNPTSAAGGSGGEEFADAQARFASALLSRDRVVTRADLYAVARSFDRRIVDVAIRSGLDRSAGGIRRVEHVTVRLNRDDFHDPELESRRLIEDLEAALSARALHDTALVAGVAWEGA
jgi:hypothetical protein